MCPYLVPELRDQKAGGSPCPCYRFSNGNFSSGVRIHSAHSSSDVHTPSLFSRGLKSST